MIRFEKIVITLLEWIHTFSKSQQYVMRLSYDADEGLTCSFLCKLLNLETTSSTFKTQI